MEARNALSRNANAENDEEKSNGAPRAADPSYQQMEKARATLMKKCKQTQKTFRQLCYLLEKFRSEAESAGDLIDMFAERCYKSDNTPIEKAIKLAENFCNQAFGNVDNVYRKGAKDAFEEIVKRDAKVLCANMWDYELGNYFVGPQLGKGGTSIVYIGEHRDTNERVALKVYKKKFAKNAAKEGNLLKELKHKNIIKVYDIYENCEWETGKTTIMIMECASQGEVIDFLIYTGRFEPKLSRWVFRGVCEAIHYCHSQDPQVIHRDLKHDNALFSLTESGEFVVKVNDFGFSKKLHAGQSMKTALGTEQYAAPELLAQKPYGSGCDIFSLGVMLFIMLSGVQPHNRAEKSDPWYKHIIRGNWGDFWKLHTKRAKSHQFTSEEKHLIQKMLEYNPKNRYNVQEILSHDWLASEKSIEDTYDSKKVRHVLKKRKMMMDQKKFRKEQELSAGKSEKTRAMDDLGPQVPARSYHTNYPAGGLWFYSYDRPIEILSNIDAMVRDIRGKTDYQVLLPGHSSKVEKQEKNEEDPAPIMVFKPLVVDTSDMTAMEAVAHGQYRLKFLLKTIARDPATKEKVSILSTGSVNIYACPDDAEVSIVIFKPGQGTDTLLFPKLYAQLLEGQRDSSTGGMAKLMVHPEEAEKLTKRLKEKEREAMTHRRKHSVDMAPTFLDSDFPEDMY